MAQFVSDTYEGMSTLPTNSHGGMVMGHRCAVVFTLAASLTAADTLLLGKLPAGYIIDEVLADTEGVAGLSLSITQTDSLTAPVKTTVLTDDIDVSAAGRVAAKMKLPAVRAQGENVNTYLVAKVIGTGALAKGKEIGVTFKYRYRQPTA